MRIEFESESISGLLEIEPGARSVDATFFGVELDRNFGGSWPRLHVEVEYRETAGSGAIVENVAVDRDSAFRGRISLSFSGVQDPEVTNAVAAGLLDSLAGAGVGGFASLRRVDTSIETGPIIGTIVGDLTGLVIGDYVNGLTPRFEEHARRTMDRYLHQATRTASPPESEASD
ncbi:hypothetical protein [Herbiconiux solani]|uniref:hypothetical protein n=1 Tax=Herbiconiux solani TaxID=661329 RepID=UPI000826E046|nr:hypothetical protein [Herbiconiux solani]